MYSPMPPHPTPAKSTILSKMLVRTHVPPFTSEKKTLKSILRNPTSPTYSIPSSKLQEMNRATRSNTSVHNVANSLSRHMTENGSSPGADLSNKHQTSSVAWEIDMSRDKTLPLPPTPSESSLVNSKYSRLHINVQDKLEKKSVVISPAPPDMTRDTSSGRLALKQLRNSMKQIGVPKKASLKEMKSESDIVAGNIVNDVASKYNDKYFDRRDSSEVQEEKNVAKSLLSAFQEEIPHLDNVPLALISPELDDDEIPLATIQREASLRRSLSNRDSAVTLIHGHQYNIHNSGPFKNLNSSYISNHPLSPSTAVFNSPDSYQTRFISNQYSSSSGHQHTSVTSSPQHFQRSASMPDHMYSQYYNNHQMKSRSHSITNTTEVSNLTQSFYTPVSSPYFLQHPYIYYSTPPSSLSSYCSLPSSSNTSSYSESDNLSDDSRIQKSMKKKNASPKRIGKIDINRAKHSMKKIHV
jgi:hypothetical protein